MKGFFLFAITFSALLSFFLNSLIVEGCNYYRSPNEEVEEGTRAFYYIRVRNNNHPLSVQIKAEILQNISYFDVENTEFELRFGETGYIHLYVYTQDVDVELIITNCSVYEKDELEEEYHEEFNARFDTTINHPIVDDNDDDTTSPPNAWLGIIPASVFGILLVYLFRRKFPVIAIRGYSHLKKNEIMNNQNRKMIYDFICYNHGATQSKMRKELNIVHRRMVQHHLDKLMKFGYVRKVDDQYYPAYAKIPKPLLERIKEAKKKGLVSTTKIAEAVGAHPDTIRYHMNKHGLREKKYSRK